LDPILVTIIIIAVSAFLIGFLQIDHMFWKALDYHWAKKEFWIPELGISWKNAFILFCGLVIGAFYTLVVLLLLML